MTSFAPRGPKVSEEEACDVSRHGGTSFSHDELLKKITAATEGLFCRVNTGAVYKPCLKNWKIEETLPGDLGSILVNVEKDVEKTPLGMCKDISSLASELVNLLNYKNVEVTPNGETLSIKTHAGYQSYAYPAATDEAQEEIDFWLRLKTMSASQVREEIRGTYEKLAAMQARWNSYHQKMLEFRNNCKIRAVGGGSAQVEIDKDYRKIFETSKQSLKQILGTEENFLALEESL